MFSMDDVTLASRFPRLIYDGTARSNCDQWLAYNSATDSEGTKGMPAINFARSRIFDDVGACDVPNLYQLMVLFIESETIDSLDTSLPTWYEFALGQSNMRSRWKFGTNNEAYSCTDCGDGVWTLQNSGYIQMCAKNKAGIALIPVCEIT